jgi:hypothetical protein
VTGDYFDQGTVERQRLLFAVATRRQLERWEPIVASHVRLLWANGKLDGMDIWSAEIEHHFLLIAARNLCRALDLPPATSVAIDPTVRAELIEGRDLHEHWDENVPIFNVTPRPADPPRRSGKEFAARNPKTGPYWWLGFSHKSGAELLPNVSSLEVHELLDAVEAEVLRANPALSRFVPPRAPSPWLYHEGEWWPKPDDGSQGPGGELNAAALPVPSPART